MDEFLPIYWLLSHPTKQRPAYTVNDADQLDITVVAMLLGIRPDDPDDEFVPLSGDFANDSARLIAKRMADARAAEQVPAEA